METTNKPNRIHPLVAIAAVSVTVLSLAGVAAITGLLPTSHGESGPGSAAVASLMAPAASGTVAQANAGASAEPEKTKTASPSTAAPKGQQQAAEDDAPAKPAPKAAARHTTQHHNPRPASNSYAQQTAQARPICHDCGRVESVQAVQEQGQASGVGVVAGAVLGGVLANQIGGGSGRKIATAAGAVGGGFAGNEVEKRARATTSYRVHVRMEDGTARSFRQTTDNWRIGDRVRIVNGELTLRG